MRTFGRIGGGQNGIGGTWIEVDTDANGYQDMIWLTTLCQTLLLNRGESPFFGAYGIPAVQSVITQVAPDYYVAQTQQQFAQYFASLTISRVSAPNPTYNIRALCNSGAILQTQVAL